MDKPPGSSFHIACFYKYQYESGGEHRKEGEDVERKTSNMEEEEAVFAGAN